MRLDDLGVDEDEYLTLADMLARQQAAPAVTVPVEAPAPEMASPTRRAPLVAPPQAVADVRADEELAAAREFDAEGGFRRGVTGAASNFINTLTRGAAPGARQAPAESRVRELLAQRAQQREAEMARRRLGLEETRASNEAARTKAYEADLASRGLRAESAAKVTEKRLGLEEKRLGLESQRVDISKEEAAVRKALAERKMKGGGPVAADEIPFDGGRFVATKKIDKTKASKALEVASTWNAALAGMGSLEQSIAEYARNPSLANKAKVEAQVSAVAGAANAAQGQGAMANDEFRRISAAMGADLATPTGVAATVASWFSGEGDQTQAAQLLLSKVRQSREIAGTLARAKLDSYGYKWSKDGAAPAAKGTAAPKAAPPPPEAPGGQVRFKTTDGQVVTLDREDAEELQAAGEGEIQ